MWRAVVGDAAVMRVVALPAINAPKAHRITLSPGGFQRLLEAIDGSFARDVAGQIIPVDATLEPNDAFYAAQGRFTLLNPCNEWTRRVLLAAGVPGGRWTPATQSFAAGLRRHGATHLQAGAGPGGGVQP